jgi:SulP family sulfate permease
VILYEIAGPFFFGSTEKAMAALDTVAGKARFVILHMGAVPAMDVTGLVALESALEKLHRQKIEVIISGVQEQPAQVLARGGIQDQPGKLALCPTLDEAVARVRQATGAPAA